MSGSRICFIAVSELARSHWADFSVTAANQTLAYATGSGIAGSHDDRSDRGAVVNEVRRVGVLLRVFDGDAVWICGLRPLAGRASTGAVSQTGVL